MPTPNAAPSALAAIPEGHEHAEALHVLRREIATHGHTPELRASYAALLAEPALRADAARIAQRDTEWRAFLAGCVDGVENVKQTTARERTIVRAGVVAMLNAWDREAKALDAASPAGGPSGGE